MTGSSGGARSEREAQGSASAPGGEATEWITAKALMLAVSGRVPEFPTIDTKSFCARAHAGMIRTRAKLYVIDGVSSADADLPREFWWTKGEAALQQNWKTGDFSWSYSTQHAAAINVVFAKHDAEAMGVEFGPSSDAASASIGNAAEPARNTGGRKQSPKWPDFVAELCAFLHDEGVPAGSGTEGAEAVIDAVDERLIKRGLGETLARTTVQSTVNAVLKRMRADN